MQRFALVIKPSTFRCLTSILLHHRLVPPRAIMSTLADELLNDFEEDNGSEDGGDHQNELVQGSASPPGPNGHQRINGSMIVDDEEDEAEDEEMINGSNGMEDAQDEEETKAKVEKMQLGGVSDVRNVAGLMKTLEPVLEVRDPLPRPFPALSDAQGLHLKWT